MNKRILFVSLSAILIIFMIGCHGGSGDNSFNQSPVANAGADATAQINDEVTLDGSGSTDVDGDQLTYTWSLIKMPAGSAAQLSDPAAVNPHFIVDVDGTYIAQLNVNDGLVDRPMSMAIS